MLLYFERTLSYVQIKYYLNIILQRMCWNIILWTYFVLVNKGKQFIWHLILCLLNNTVSPKVKNPYITSREKVPVFLVIINVFITISVFKLKLFMTPRHGLVTADIRTLEMECLRIAKENKKSLIRLRLILQHLHDWRMRN